MLIESKIKPSQKPTRTVKCFGTNYEFKQLPNLPGRYIADVADPDAIKALIATGAYVEFTEKVESAGLKPHAPSKAERAAASAGEQTAAAASTAAGDGPPQPFTADEIAKAEELLSGVPAAIKKAVNAGPTEAYPANILKAALSIEGQAEKPRPSVVTALERALS